MSAGNVVLAQPRGFCAGVRRAIGIVERALDMHGAPVYVRKEIVHNHHIVSELRTRGAVFVDSEEEVPHGAVCVFSAHGVSPGVRTAAADRQLDVIDATCPLVSKVHQEAVRFARDGRTILLVGHEGHEEIEGVLGASPPTGSSSSRPRTTCAASACPTTPRSPCSPRPPSRSTRPAASSRPCAPASPT